MSCLHDSVSWRSRVGVMFGKAPNVCSHRRYLTSAVGAHGFSQRPIDNQYTTSTQLCPGGAGALPKVMVNTGIKQRDNTQGLR